jgi:Na+(H+)/acetate symporter ActP
MSFMIAGFMVVGAIAFLVAKFGSNFIRKMLGMDIVVDVAVTVLLCWMFAITGTISGMLTGIFCGLIISALLFFGKKLFTHQKFMKVGGKYRWVNVPGEWR